MKKKKTASFFKKERTWVERNYDTMVKKGEITSGQLILMILLIIGFVIIVYFLYSIFNWNPIIDEQACHESVVFRSTVNFGFIKSSKIVPLKCQTEKICMSMSKNDCNQVGKNTPNNPVTKINLDKDPIKARQQILDQFAESMRKCHSMLGEGQLLFMPERIGWGEKYWTGTNYCLICARIVLDEEAMQKIDDISYAELYRELGTKALPDKKSYLEYLYPDWKDWHSVWRLFQQFKDNKLSQLQNINTIEDWKMNISDEGGFAIVAQIAPKSYWMVFTKAGAGLGATAIGAAIIGAPITVTLGGAALVGGAIFWYYSPTGQGVEGVADNPIAYSPPAVVPYSLENLQGMKCDSFEVAP